MQLPDLSKITVDKIELPQLNQKGISLHVLRLDKIHPVISGNKWFKLKYYFAEFKKENYKGVLTFGGAWSNHLLATACAAKLENIPCAGIVRGEKPSKLSATLIDCIQYGMELEFMPREMYSLKNSSHHTDELKQKFRDYLIIPEGGAGPPGEKGAGEIPELAGKEDYTHVLCAMGTGTMLTGIANSIPAHQQLIGIPVLKGMNNLKEQLSNVIKNDRLNDCRFFYQYHFGGYAKKTAQLISFMNDFYKQTGIPTDFVYTGKLAYAVIDLLQQNHFPDGSTLLMIHSGGLQGNASLPKGTLIF